jgi:hypothetical protein
MPKLSRGRLDGLEGMDSFTYQELYALANNLEAQIDDPNNTDDPAWLKRWAEKARALGRKKEKSTEHKENRK